MHTNYNMDALYWIYPLWSWTYKKIMDLDQQIDILTFET